MFAYAHKLFCSFARFIYAESVAIGLRKISTLNRLQRGRAVHAEPVTVWLAVRAESVTCPRVIRRGGYETQLNLAKDLVTDTFRTRRMPTADPTYYNQLAAEAGLPQASGPVSQEDMDRMRYVLRFNDRYTTRLAGMGDPTVVLREVVALKAAELQQGQRANALIEGQVLEMGAVLSTLVEGKLAATAGSLR